MFVASEYVRAALLAQHGRTMTLLAYLISVLSDVLIAGGVRGIETSYKLMDFVGLTLFPAITANILFNYVSKRYGMLPNVSYRLLLTLYVYVIPFVSDAPQILSAFANLILPLIIYFLIDSLFEKKRRLAKEKKSRFGFIIPTLMFTVMICFILLVSCKFRYGILVIGSPSMSGEINTGDAVVFESYEYCDGAKENEIVVFSKNGKTTVVHRIIEINVVNGQNQYITKGDANDDPDVGFITDEDIIGIVRTKVLYIGYPSLWLNEIFK